MEKEPKRFDKIAMETTLNDIFPIVESINQYFDGNLYQVSKSLDKAIYLFHYIPESDLFSEKEKQGICFTLMELKEGFLEAFFEQQSKSD